MVPSAKQQLGTWLHERWWTELILRMPWLAKRFGMSWVDLCNRHEALEVDPRTGGRVCLWTDSSPLTVSRFFPEVGGRVLQHVLRRWPVEFCEKPAAEPAVDPVVSLIVGVRGRRRLPQFQCCLESLRAQVGVTCEIIIVEQSWEPEFQSLLPNDVRYVHLQATDPDMPFNRSWGLNAGARASRGRILVLHDADMVVPKHFAEAVAARIDSGLDAIRLPRFIFYLDEPTSLRIQQSRQFPPRPLIDNIVQNNPTPIAIKRDVYLDIGGHDESFYGWGAEDNEFMDRLRTTKLGEGTFLPIFHLWHEVAPNRVGDRNAAQLKRSRAKTPAARIEELAARPFGEEVPSVEWNPPQPTTAATIQ